MVRRDALTRPHPPTTKCPKCGDQYGFVERGTGRFVDPVYEPATDGWGTAPRHDERLRWECRSCGYTVYTPTADAPK